jgi:hypothetical protein
MSEQHLKLLLAHFEKLQHDCDTPEKAVAQLRSEGLLDETGATAPLYRDSSS